MRRSSITYRTSYIVLLLSLLTMGCTDADRFDLEGNPVQVDLAFSVSSATHTDTRLVESVIQTTPTSYRGIEQVLIIPFNVRGKITAEDNPMPLAGGKMELKYRKENDHIYYTQQCIFIRGMASCLCYARAIPFPVNEPNKAMNGSLQASSLNVTDLTDITFSPEQIYTPEDGTDGLPLPSTKAQALATYLTDIANTYGWKDSPNATLRTRYIHFIPFNGVMAGSSNNVRNYVNELYTTISDFSPANEEELALKTRILKKVQATHVVVTDGKVTSLGAEREGYPGNIGLPDGVAALSWSESEHEFKPQLTKTSIAPINDVRAFAFPAELYYYANSRIRTSNQDDRKTYYDAATRSWESMLTAYEYDNSVVSGSTKAVAIKEPLQYAVARLQVALNQTSTMLSDANGKQVEVRASSFPLTGVIVGNQYPVGYDFTPKSTTDSYLMYDSQVQSATGDSIYMSSSTSMSDPVNTFVLQSPEGEDVMLVLEFQNNSGTDFRGAGGIIYQGTKFYLIGTLELASLSAEAGSVDLRKRVFTQCHTTTVNVTIPSLERAYNVMPNIRSPYLEVGVQLTSAWVQAETTNVVLK